jgi:hypothetical protein
LSVPRIRVDYLALDEVNKEKLAAHGISTAAALQVLETAPRVFRNVSPDGAPYVLIGPDLNGRLITLPIDPTAWEDTWRPRTGYPSSGAECRRYSGR